MRERRDFSGGPEAGALTSSMQLVGGCRVCGKKKTNRDIKKQAVCGEFNKDFYKKKKNEGKEIFKEIIAENFPGLLKVISYLVTVDN